MISNEPIWWLFLNVLSLVVLAFYSMQEMACVSMNRIRLHYYVSIGNRRAQWINTLLQAPSKMFGTTLICVNVALLVGSECAREFYSSLGVDPDFAPLTQVFIVIIFAELAPMFAARRYSESVAMFGSPLLYATSVLLSPILWSISALTSAADWLLGRSGISAHETVLNQEDLQVILQAQEEEPLSDKEKNEFDMVTTHIFQLRKKIAMNVMHPLESQNLLPANLTVAQIRKYFQKPGTGFICLYHRYTTNVVGIVTPRELLRAHDNRRVREYAHSPWFITQNTPANQILKQFRHNKENVAVVLNAQGQAIGILTLDDLIEEIFGKEEQPSPSPEEQKARQLFIERTFPGDMKISEFNAQFDVVLEEEGDATLAELMEKLLGHKPEKGESVYLPPFELEVKEASLLEVKSITITTRIV